VERLSLEEWRKRKGFETQQDLVIAGQGDFSTATIWRIEHGQVVPERTTRRAIARVLGVPVEAIIWPETADKPTS
jgi:DNA-binding XRE family transcriptional regulator